MSRIFLSPPYMCGNEQKYVQEAFDTNWIAPLGANVTAFEKEMAAYIRREHALATNAGTAAIHLALRYLGVGRDDLVFCSDLTFAGSCNPILYQAAQPVFIDSQPESWNMSPSALEDALRWAKAHNRLPKAVIIVDLYGQSANYDALLPLCEAYGVPVIEDAAEAAGTTYGDKRCGAFGDMGILSFNGNKIVNTSGGGMVLSDDKAAVDKMLFWATQAREKELHYEHKDFGYNYRLSNVCAGIGRGQLDGLEGKLAKRGAIYERYAAHFASAPLSMMPTLKNSRPNRWLSVALLNDAVKATPWDVCAALERENIESRPVWKPMHMQPVFAGRPYFAHEGKDIGRSLFQRGVCLPSGEALTENEQSLVVSAVLGAIA